MNHYLETFKPWITVVTVSEWYDSMFQNWWHWYQLLDLKMEVILVAEDVFIAKKYKNETSIKVITDRRTNKVCEKVSYCTKIALSFNFRIQRTCMGPI